MSQKKSFLKYEITGAPAFATVRITLEQPGQQVKAEAGAMIWMDGHIQMHTKSGGIKKGFKRMFSGESFFQNYFELPADSSSGTVAFSFGVPGDIMHLHLEQGEKWSLSRDVYICGTPSIEVSTKRGGLKQMFSGEGYFLTNITATAEGDVWLGGYGYIEKHELVPGQELVVDNGVMMAFQDKMEHKFSKVGGKKEFIAGGEGVVIRYKGPGIVYTQSREIGLLAGMLRPYLNIP